MSGEPSAWADLTSKIGTYWPVLAPPAVSVIAVWKYFADKRSARNEQQAKRDELEASNLAERRRQLSADADSYLDRIEAENERLRQEVARLQIDLERGWDLARECHDGWRNVTNKANAAAHELAALIRTGQPLPTTLLALPEVPALETLKGRRPTA